MRLIQFVDSHISYSEVSTFITRDVFINKELLLNNENVHPNRYADNASEQVSMQRVNL